jgi:hypothetical protein
MNTGRQPASNAVMHITGFTAPTKAAERLYWTVKKLAEQCPSSPGENIGVLYPSNGYSYYKYALRVPKERIDAGVVDGTNMILAVGCVTYDTFQTPHVSKFCFFYKKGLTAPGEWNNCRKGNQAD